jgi:peptide/nickel transport system substrate-binding protein
VARPLTRRSWLAGAAGLLLASRAQALGRVPVGGSIRFHLPWSTARLDPHDLFDPIAAIFGHAIADPAYARDASGRVHPALADGMPTVEGEQTVVRLRSGLVTAAGKPLGGRDLAWSVTRARKMGAAALLGPLGAFVRSDDKEPLIARFGKVAPERLALLLSSPLTALLPVGFSPAAPDGTGPFVARCTAQRIELTRNGNAARGAAFLERIVVISARDLDTGLRAFEAGEDDVGWLGLGFHRNRSDVRRFGYSDVGWIVLCAGSRASGLRAPGAAQRLADSVPVERLHIGLGARPGVSGGEEWKGGNADLLYDASHGHLALVAEAVASKLSGSGGEIRSRGVSGEAVRRARQSGDFALALDIVRHPGAGPGWTAIVLAQADRLALGVEMAKRPPLGAGDPAHRHTGRLRLGVLGAIDVRGAAVKGLLLPPHASTRGFELGNGYKS